MVVTDPFEAFKKKKEAEKKRPKIGGPAPAGQGLIITSHRYDAVKNNPGTPPSSPPTDLTKPKGFVSTRRQITKKPSVSDSRPKGFQGNQL